ncbi:hypothetical protein C3L33_13931, partial [Rhododendron williamsianum]
MAIRRRREISLLTIMMKQIMATHTPNGREFGVRPLLHVVEDVMHRATPIIPSIAHATQAQLEALDEKALHCGFSGMLELLPYPINRIARERLSMGVKTFILGSSMHQFSFENLEP